MTERSQSNKGKVEVPQAEFGKVNKAETVRTIIRDSANKILLLQKSNDSKNPLKYEFPGGKIDGLGAAPSTLAQQTTTAIKEVEEETGLEISGLPLSKVDAFSYKFKVGDKEYERAVTLFLVDLPPGNYQVVVDRTLNEEGSSEDKHQGARWVSMEELIEIDRENMLAANSRISVLTTNS